jgi:hypothetical protein
MPRIAKSALWALLLLALMGLIWQGLEVLRGQVGRPLALAIAAAALAAILILLFRRR